MRTGFVRTILTLMFAWSSLIFTASVHAQSPDDSVHDLDFKQGDREIEFKAGTTDPRGSGRESAAFLGIEYGLRDNWSTQLGASYRREPGHGLRFDSLQWQNKFRFLDAPDIPVKVGLLAEVNFPDDSDDGYRLVFGPLLQKELGNMQINFNLLFERHLDEHPSQPTEMAYQLQAKYQLKAGLEVGVQGFGDVGEWDDWAPRGEQSHRFGPAIFGEFSLGSKRKFEYDAAYLTDPSSSTRSHGVRLRVKYQY
jgi:hypothetical protein